MTRDEIKEFLMILQVKFPNFKIPPEKAKFVVDAWYEDLENYDYITVKKACAAYRDTANTAFAPSTSQLIGLIRSLNSTDLSSTDAWVLVHKAICSSRDTMEETFEKLPAPIQRAIGSPRMLREWSTLDSEEIHNSIHPRFLRSYEVAVKDEGLKPYMSTENKLRLEQVYKAALPQIETKREKVYGISKEVEEKLNEFYRS